MWLTDQVFSAAAMTISGSVRMFIKFSSGDLGLRVKIGHGSRGFEVRFRVSDVQSGCRSLGMRSVRVSREECLCFSEV